VNFSGDPTICTGRIVSLLLTAELKLTASGDGSDEIRVLLKRCPPSRVHFSYAALSRAFIEEAYRGVSKTRLSSFEWTGKAEVLLECGKCQSPSSSFISFLLISQSLPQ
jgi:hypothetical protein